MINMAWQKVKDAFFVVKDGKLQHIDIAVCSTCNGIHIPPEKANACGIVDSTSTYEDVKKKFNTASSEKEGK